MQPMFARTAARRRQINRLAQLQASATGTPCPTRARQSASSSTPTRPLASTTRSVCGMLQTTSASKPASSSTRKSAALSSLKCAAGILQAQIATSNASTATTHLSKSSAPTTQSAHGASTAARQSAHESLNLPSANRINLANGTQVRLLVSTAAAWFLVTPADRTRSATHSAVALARRNASTLTQANKCATDLTTACGTPVQARAHANAARCTKSSLPTQQRHFLQFACPTRCAASTALCRSTKNA